MNYAFLDSFVFNKGGQFNISLAALGALAHHLQRHTVYLTTMANLTPHIKNIT